jgi:type I restriction enzyme, R subunit
MTPEEKARRRIDEQLTRCGWVVQDFADMDISAGPGVAVREFPLKTGLPCREEEYAHDRRDSP